MVFGVQFCVVVLVSVVIKGLVIVFGFFKVVIILIGIGVIVIGVGYFVGKFLQLVLVVGGFGVVLKLVGDVVCEVLDFIGLCVRVMVVIFDGMLKDVQVGVWDMFVDVIVGVVDFVN